MFELSKDEVYSHTDGDAWKALLSVNANETSDSISPLEEIDAVGSHV